VGTSWLVRRKQASTGCIVTVLPVKRFAVDHAKIAIFCKDGIVSCVYRIEYARKIKPTLEALVVRSVSIRLYLFLAAKHPSPNQATMAVVRLVGRRLWSLARPSEPATFLLLVSASQHNTVL